MYEFNFCYLLKTEEDKESIKKISLALKKAISEEEYERLHRKTILHMVSTQMEMPCDLITPISYDEYLEGI